VTVRALVSILVLAGLACAQQQPLPFSHKTHSEAARMQCGDCHPAPAKFGAEMGFPTAGKCMACHVLIAREKPAIRKLSEFAAAKQEVPWERVYRLADFVFFDHRYHLIKGATCGDCHAAVAGQDVISDQQKATSMAFCQSCHTRTKAPGGCGTCHNIR
jgi:hypothetical protein